MTTLQPKQLARRIIKLAWNKKADDIVLLNLKKLASFTDYFLICSVDSDIQARVVADAVAGYLDGAGIEHRVEGYEAGRWILIDCFCVVLHVFRSEVREFYGLERLWGDAPREEFDDGA
ncbi:MAG: ribosome silencing factor [Candidatus Krumholzibacteriota bacterium]|nr:ribosome silencing factor [Candidatus Krumholzibacteriota bacterium]